MPFGHVRGRWPVRSRSGTPTRPSRPRALEPLLPRRVGSVENDRTVKFHVARALRFVAQLVLAAN
jgi:hypothetical protein